MLLKEAHLLMSHLLAPCTVPFIYIFFFAIVQNNSIATVCTNNRCLMLCTLKIIRNHRSTSITHNRLKRGILDTEMIKLWTKELQHILL